MLNGNYQYTYNMCVPIYTTGPQALSIYTDFKLIYFTVKIKDRSDQEHIKGT